MVVIPAVDLMDGQVVRLTRGQRDKISVYSDRPVDVAKRWVDAGATWLHVVDLNGAFDGRYTNLRVAKQIIASCHVNVQLSGGIRTKDALAEAFGAGAARVVLGTKACEDPEFVQEVADRHGRKIAVAIDADAGQVVSRGWVTKTSVTPAQLARSVTMLGVETVICTDVSRDGTLEGPNLDLLTEILDAGVKELIASGGISSIEDLRKIKKLESRGIVGAIVGKALYEGAIDAREAFTSLQEAA